MILCINKPVLKINNIKVTHKNINNFSFFVGCCCYTRHFATSHKNINNSFLNNIPQTHLRPWSQVLVPVNINAIIPPVQIVHIPASLERVILSCIISSYSSRRLRPTLKIIWFPAHRPVSLLVPGGHILFTFLDFFFFSPVFFLPFLYREKQILKKKKILRPPNWPLVWPPAGQETNVFLFRVALVKGLSLPT